MMAQSEYSYCSSLRRNDRGLHSVGCIAEAVDQTKNGTVPPYSSEYTNTPYTGVGVSRWL